MKTLDLQQGNRIIALYFSFLSKVRAMDEIALSGPTQETKLAEFHGDFPQLSNIKPDIVASKVDRIRRIYINSEEIAACQAIMALPKLARPFLTEFHARKGTHNPDTQKPWTHADCAKLLKRKPEEYEKVREASIQFIIKVYKVKTARPVGEKINVH